MFELHLSRLGALFDTERLYMDCSDSEDVFV